MAAPACPRIRGPARDRARAGLELPVLAAVRASNAHHLDWLIERIRARQAPPGPSCLGLAFKPGTDDLRHSPWLELAAALVRAGFDLRAVDPELDPRHLVGANLRVALEHREIPFERLRREEGGWLKGRGGGVPVLDLTRLALEAPIPAVPDRTGSS